MGGLGGKVVLRPFLVEAIPKLSLKFLCSAKLITVFMETRIYETESQPALVLMNVLFFRENNLQNRFLVLKCWKSGRPNCIQNLATLYEYLKLC